jgi:hypothetical protein
MAERLRKIATVKKRRVIVAFALVLVFVMTAVQAMAQTKGKAPSTEELQKAAQNPVADLISIPLQNNFNFGVGPQDKMQYVGNIQPVIPLHATENWNVITRTIMPLVYQPELAPGVGDVFGLGDIQFTAFLSPAKPGGFIWGVGPILQMPSGTDDSITSGKWAAGPSAVALKMDGHWVYGVLANYLSSFAGQSDRGAVSQWLIQPFVNYNMADGWYLTTAPIITANMMVDNSDRWTVPIGGGVGRLIRVDKLPLNMQLQGFYNIAHPDAGADWSIRFQIQLLLPESLL